MSGIIFRAHPGETPPALELRRDGVALVRGVPVDAPGVIEAFSAWIYRAAECSHGGVALRAPGAEATLHLQGGADSIGERIKGAEAERARVVEWLRAVSPPQWPKRPQEDWVGENALCWAADAIERGDHEKGGAK